MTNKVTLRDIHKDNKAINRNLQRLANIELLRLRGKSAVSDKKTNDTVGKSLARAGLILIAASEMVLLIGDIVDYRNEKIEQELEEYDK